MWPENLVFYLELYCIAYNLSVCYWMIDKQMNLLLLILGNYEQHYFIYHCEDFLQFDPMFTYTCNPGRILKMFLKDDPHNYFIEKGVEGYIYRKEK